MPLYRLVLLLLLASGLLPLAASAQLLPGRSGSAVVVTERVRAELLAHAPEGLAPGKPVWLGLQIAHQPEWHTYWKNPGDSGLPTVLDWQMPAGLTPGEIRWPVPRRIPIGHLANYGYEGTVLLPVPLEVGGGFQAGSDATIRLKATWLVCKLECIPEEGEFTLRLPASGSVALHGAAFEAAFAALPRPLPSGAAASARVEDGALALRVGGLPAALRGQRLELFPEVPGVTEPAAEWTQAWDGDAWTARVPLSPYRSASPQLLPVVLAGGAQGWRAELAVAGPWPQAAAQAQVPAALEEALRQNAAQAPRPSTPAIGLWAALLGALVGGLILNLMPCVFPVLAIKMLSFTARVDNLQARRASGLAYSAGVVLSFVVLGAALLALRAAGEQLGWGFQLQSPAVIAGLALLFTLLALNLAGVFEFGALLPSGLATRELKHPVANSFLSGVLAVAVASPCTAPFMGASLGLAIVLPPAQALTVFAMLGLGMALPYLLATWLPAVARLLPRPGPWMQTFRQLMAFPLFATVAWLVWVLGRQSGVDGAGALLGLLVLFSLLVWALTLRGRTRGVLAGLAALALAGTAWTLGPRLLEVPAQATAQAADGAWEPWSESRVRELVAEGRPVFVDFTAAWCITCQYNKQTTLSDTTLMAEMREQRVALLRADWTRRDPAITEALQSLGRSGVPVYAVYRGEGPPQVLSEILSVAEVRAAIVAR